MQWSSMDCWADHSPPNCRSWNLHQMYVSLKIFALIALKDDMQKVQGYLSPGLKFYNKIEQKNSFSSTPVDNKCLHTLFTFLVFIVLRLSENKTHLNHLSLYLAVCMTRKVNVEASGHSFLEMY